MKTIKTVLDIIVKVVAVILMLLVAGIVTMMLTELIARNFFNKSFRFSTELCGFLFMWMAFLGVIVLYHKDRLITLDILYLHVPKTVQTCFWYLGKIAAILLGVIMIIAYANMYKINSTSYFSTMQFISKAWHFLPMCLAGGFIALDSVYMMAAKALGVSDADEK